MSDATESRLARIESHVEHINEVTTDLRVELRRTNDKMDAGFQAVNKKIDDNYKGLCEKIEGGDKESGSAYKELNKKIDDHYKDAGNAYKELNKKVDDGLQATNKRIDDVKDKLHSMTIWALLLYVTLAGGLLTIIGRAFKWI